MVTRSAERLPPGGWAADRSPTARGVDAEGSPSHWADADAIRAFIAEQDATRGGGGGNIGLNPWRRCSLWNCSAWTSWPTGR